MSSQGSDRNLTQLSDMNSTNRTQSSVAVVTISHSLKITLLGDSSVGKTSLITKYCEKTFNPKGTNPTINVAIQEKTIKIDAFTEAKLSIWDTAGAEQYLSFTKGYLRESNGIIIVFDFTNEKSFNNLNTWINLINSDIEEGKAEKILVGNKSDLPDAKISVEMAQQYAGVHGMKFISVSAKDGVNIDYLFEVLANDCVKKLKESDEKEKNKEKEEKISVKVDNNKKEKKSKGKCC